MTNREVIEAFKEGKTYALGCHLYIKGNELVNYSTTIAKRLEGGKIALNVRKYTHTTGKIQSLIKSICNDLIVEEYEGEPATIWNYGYQGARRITSKEIK